jgi:predicted O-methyltransferase YrrM
MDAKPMSSGGYSLDFLRRRVKRLVRDDRFRWLGRPARRLWYYWRAINELQNVPAVLLQAGNSQRALPMAQLVEYVFASFGGLFRPFQNRAELQRFMMRASQIKPQTVLEIGTARGGTLFLLSIIAAPNAELISIDLPAGLYGGGYPAWKGNLYRRLMGEGQRLRLIRGNSHDPRTLEKVQKLLAGRPVDLLFIDGDHSYDGAKCDFLQYRAMVRPGGLIAFHDILENKSAPEITVAPLWKEISRAYETEEIVDSYAQGEFGIGIVMAPEIWKDR